MRARSIVIALGFGLSVAPIAAAEPTPTLDDVMTYLHFDTSERARVLKGEVVGKEFRERDEKEISIAVVLRVATPLAKLAEDIRKGRLLQADEEVLDFRASAPGTPLDETFRAAGYTSGEGEEIRRLLAAKSGAEFNLSAEELERLRTARTRFPGGDCDKKAEACAGEVSGLYRAMLQERTARYKRDGLDGIAPYDRGSGKTVHPGDELRRAAEDAELIRRAFPAFYRAFTGFPREQSDRYESQFLWIKRRVQGRPAFALAHRLFDVRPDRGIVAERQFYVGTSYNSLQTFIGLLPDGDHTVLMYTNRTFSDQVAGAGSHLKHSVGRSKMMSAVTAIFETLRAPGPK
ncbi:MAG TPA: hypothetical protein VGS03_03590 [Candidatus Polarisedimenticolia bacterium]|nr:hypothetical protein [Candidatus Polarisedimenticolia bacterium]